MISKLTTGSIPRHLFRLTLPTIGGFMAITAFNLTDTYFVARLGTQPLAAMGFTFPIVMVVGALGAGVSQGAGSVLARAIGAGNTDRIRHTASYGILLALAITAVIGVIGLLTMEPLFRALGADEQTIPYIKQYMTVWYAGCVVILTPPVGDANLRSTGDMIRPFIVMAICAGVNIVMDPLLIFGYGPFPEMGIQGAAVATIISRSCGMVATLVFNFRAGLIDLKNPRWKVIWETWKRILFIGVPAVVTQLMPSVLKGVLTALTAGVAGTAGVAALAVGSRVESIPMLIAWAFNSALLAVVGQNWGAGKQKRVETTRNITLKLSFLYGLPLAVLMWFLAPAAAGIFTDDGEVIRLTVMYLRIIMLPYTGVVLFGWTAVLFNAVGKPLLSLLLNLVGTLVFLIPGAVIGRYVGGFTGMVVGLSIGQLLTGILAYGFSRHVMDS